MGKSTVIQSLLLIRQSCDRDGRIREIRLSGELFSAGTARDAVRLDADRKLKIELSEEQEGDFTVTGAYDSGTNPRTLSLERECAAPKVLADRAGKMFCYLSAERVGPRVTYPIATDSSDLGGAIGKQGENSAFFLSRCKVEGARLHDGWYSVLPTFKGFTSPPMAPNKPPNLEDVSIYHVANAFLSWVVPGATFDAIENDEADYSRLTFNHYRRDPNAYVRPTNIGYGLTQVLPVIAGLVALDRNGLFLLENPEAHLHPLGQSRIGSIVALGASSGPQIVLETHSDHVVNGIRLAVKMGWIKSEHVVFHYFVKSPEENQSSVEVLSVDAGGRLSNWPSGFFDQIEKDLANL